MRGRLGIMVANGALGLCALGCGGTDAASDTAVAASATNTSAGPSGSMTATGSVGAGSVGGAGVGGGSAGGAGVGGGAGASVGSGGGSGGAVASASINAVFPPLSPNDPSYTDFGTYVLTSSVVDGVNPHLDWAAVDKGPGAAGGQYQWAAFDLAIQRFIDAQKTVNVIVMPINYSATNSATPSYVLTDSNQPIVSCTNISSYPVPYATPFKSAYKAFIAEVIAHFAGNAHIGYIRFGLSRGGEIFPLCQTQMKALPAPNTYSEQVWISYDKEMLDWERAHSPTMQIMAPTTVGGGDTGVASDYCAAANPLDTPGHAYTNCEAAQALADGFGFGDQGLAQSDVTSDPSCNGDWCREFDWATGKVPLELQTIGLSDPSGTCTPSCIDNNQKLTGPLPPLLALGLAHHATVFEIYTGDLMVALNPNNPSYAAYHTAYSDALAAVR